MPQCPVRPASTEENCRHPLGARDERGFIAPQRLCAFLPRSLGGRAQETWPAQGPDLVTWSNRRSRRARGEPGVTGFAERLGLAAPVTRIA